MLTTLLIIETLPPSLFYEMFTRHIQITYSMIIVILILLLGLIFFIITQQIIRNLIEQGIKSELKKINMKSKETYDKIIEISFNKKDSDYKNDLEEIKMILDLLEREERKIKERKHKRFDIKTISTFITTFLLSIITASSSIIKTFLLPIITAYLSAILDSIHK